jgi:hypothetical protein
MLKIKHLVQRLLIFKVFLLILLTNGAYAQEKLIRTLTPDQVVIQYAGSIGYFSLGAGYNFFKDKSTLSFHYGHVPENKGGTLNIAAVKFDYKPFSIVINDKITFLPVNPVFFLSYTFGKDFGLRFNRDQYAKGYYFWSPALREHLGLNSEVRLLGDKSSKIKSVSIYAEANTNDLYMISWYENRTTTPIYEIFHLGFGVKLNF